MALPIRQNAFDVSLATTESPRPIPARKDTSSFGSSEVKASSIPLPPATSSSSLPSLSPRSSLYLAVRVRTLVNALRKRVKRRHQQNAGKKVDDWPHCRDVESEAYREIDRYLGRKPKCGRGGRHRAGALGASGVKRATRSDGTLSREGANIEGSVQRVADAASVHSIALSTIAANEELFLCRKEDFVIRNLNLKALQQLIIEVKDLLETLTCIALPHPTAATAASGCHDKRAHVLDFSYLANLVHLLLCLQSQILHQLIKTLLKVWDHVFESQKTQERACEDWFFEYPDARRPLSTTWPWAIKPSLVVLWGVCWMFFAAFDFNINTDREGNGINSQGYTVIPQQQLAQFFWELDQRAQQNAQPRDQSRTPTMPRAGSSSYTHGGGRRQANPGFEVVNPRPQIMDRRQRQPRREPARLPGPGNATMATQPQPTHYAQSHDRSQAHLDSSPTPARGGYNAHLSHLANSPTRLLQSLQAAAPVLGQAVGDSNTAYVAADPAGVAGVSWPQEAISFAGPLSGINNPGIHSAYDYAFQQQQQQQQAFWQSPQGPHQYNTGVNLAVPRYPPPPSRSGSAGPPTIRINPGLPGTPESYEQFQGSHTTSATSAQAPYIDHLFPKYLGVNMDGQNQGPSTQDGSYPEPIDHNGHVTGALPADHIVGIDTPVSVSDQPNPNSRHISTSPAPPVESSSAKKRSFSEMSQAPQPDPTGTVPTDHPTPQPVPYDITPGDGHQPYEESPTEPVEEQTGPYKVQRNIKRGDPPQAHDGKYYCNVATECAGQYFDRKCEWSKHMDKHDRPYRCPQPQCSKLQGFTYSGGLLRHEREVHNKHGGPKEQLRCSVSSCKRHIGKGFTRKENLNEHLRRVHGISVTTDASQLQQIANDAVPGAELLEGQVQTPPERFSDNAEVEEFNSAPPAYPEPAVKRRRLDSDSSPHSISDTVEMEMQRLRAAIEERDERIRQMEARDAEREERTKLLEEKVMQMEARQESQQVSSQVPQQIPQQVAQQVHQQVHQQSPQPVQHVPEHADIGTYPEFNPTDDHALQHVQQS